MVESGDERAVPSIDGTLKGERSCEPQFLKRAANVKLTAFDELLLSVVAQSVNKVFIIVDCDQLLTRVKWQ